MSLLNASAAARELGVAANTIIRWVEAGDVFPNAFKIKGTVRIPVSDIEALKHPVRKAEGA